METTPPIHTETNSPDRFADRVAIHQLLSQYCHRIDNGTGEGVGRLWVDDGVLELGFTTFRKQYPGRKALTEWYKEVHLAGRDRAKVCLHPRHSITNTRIQFVSDTEARIMASISAHDVRDGRVTLYSGYYRDDVIRKSGRWWFKVKRIHINFSWCPDMAVLFQPQTLTYF